MTLNTDLANVGAWILSSQTSVGAIAHYTDKVKIDPYLGCFAALGLSSAASEYGTTAWVDTAKQHLEWYSGSMDASGFVTDYTLIDGVFVSTGDMDSTDGYAGLFIVALHSLVFEHNVTLTPLLTSGLEGAVNAILATQTSDGLTWAKPSYKVKYLMDQAEAWAGLKAAEALAKHSSNTALLKLASGAANKMTAGIESLWDPASNSYIWAVHEDGSKVPLDPSKFYPDSLSQLWPVIFGVTSLERSKVLVDNFITQHPGWSSPDTIVPGEKEYWPTVAWALKRVGYPLEATEGAENILNYAKTVNYAWPYNPGTAGQLLHAFTAPSFPWSK